MDEFGFSIPLAETDKKLYSGLPPGIQALYKRARKELRSKARANFKASRGITNAASQDTKRDR